MAEREKLRVLEDASGKRYAKQFTPSELAEWMEAHPDHKLIR